MNEITWRGKPLEEMSRAELLAICRQLIVESITRQQRALGLTPRG